MDSIYTVGHSSHSRELFIDILQSFDIELLVDVRSYPGSRYVPSFNKESMAVWVAAAGIKYVHIKELGGRRNKIVGIDYSLVDGWRNEAFKNYSAYTLTKEYENGIDKLITLAKSARTCIVCSESVPWRCHRLIISNTLKSNGFNVTHILDVNKSEAHELNKYGAYTELFGDKLIYPKSKDTSNSLQ